ncbi:hypothetical protein DACRYDRAFT_119541 [Dacryopinax primogenitus]|uniref:DUF6533 domain-containing protein n=1 Tax=Dacryopinax primogenitus (strain DJM 731) TaxID=1858805 RepID=M5FNH6_DACPD|nr:uncharacterized protein DACRYDRAFT_119541 [Dacryopinax primogenitus]EJT97460.1 hypothetical protein DACRYDRAFT_119541 [Dacryopinax primogenitus]
MADGLGPGPSWTGTILQALYIMRLSNWIAMAATCLVAYDILLTLPAEITYIWLSPPRTCSAPAQSPLARIGQTISARRPTFLTLLYFLDRYGVLLQAALCNIANIDAGLSSEACERWTLFNNWSVPIGMLVVEVMLVLRVSALYLNNRSILFPLLLLWFFALALMCIFLSLGLSTTHPEPSLAAQVTGCLLGGVQHLFWTIWLPSLVLESTLFLLSALIILRHIREGVRTDVLRLMARDGFMYFVVIFFLLLTNVLVPLLASMPYYSIMNPRLTLCLTSILCSRLYLNLRRAAYRKRLREVSQFRERTFVSEWTIPEDLDLGEGGDVYVGMDVGEGDCEDRPVQRHGEKEEKNVDMEKANDSKLEHSSLWSRTEDWGSVVSRTTSTTPAGTSSPSTRASSAYADAGLGKGFEVEFRARGWFESSWGTMDTG